MASMASMASVSSHLGQKRPHGPKQSILQFFFEKRIRPPHPKSSKEGNPPGPIVPISRKEWTYINLSNNPGAGWTLKENGKEGWKQSRINGTELYNCHDEITNVELFELPDKDAKFDKNGREFCEMSGLNGFVFKL